MRIAALYDIHGNLPALEAVLAETGGFDRLVIGGDFVWGPFPSETVDLLRDLGDRAVIIAGNSEREVVDRLDLTGDLPPHLIAPVRWTAERLSDDQLDFIAGLPKTCVLDADDLGPTLFCHATPRSDEQLITSETPDDVLREALAGVDQEAVVCGHTHMQYVRAAAQRRVVNPGSVGIPYEAEPGAYWAAFGPGVRLRRTPYDVELGATRIRQSGFPDERLARVLLSPPNQREVIAGFEEQRRRAAEAVSGLD